MGDSLERLGTRIRRIREAAALSIGALAELADLDESYVNQIELGKRDPSYSTLVKLAGALKISFGQIVGETESKDAGLEDKISLQVRVLLQGRTPAQKASVLAILKALRDPERLKALRQLLRM
jgi:transcriptional regulator with XRE-family HTH domain